jgi:hypothetical protein
VKELESYLKLAEKGKGLIRLEDVASAYAACISAGAPWIIGYEDEGQRIRAELFKLVPKLRVLF